MVVELLLIYKRNHAYLNRVLNRSKENKDKRAEVRLQALQLRAEGKRSKEIAEIVSVIAPYVSQLAYFKIIKQKPTYGKDLVCF